MTKKELQATMLLLTEVRGAIAALKWYGEDYDSPTMRTLGEGLEKSVDKYRKETKI